MQNTQCQQCNQQLDDHDPLRHYSMMLKEVVDQRIERQKQFETDCDQALLEEARAMEAI